MIDSICICGAGTMGTGIAQAAAESGISALLYDLDHEKIRQAELFIRKNLDSRVLKNKITESEKKSITGRIRYSNQLADCHAAFLLEAIIENLDAKRELFLELEKINTGKTIFASNTSSHSISEIARSIKNPDRIVGMHFFNPPTLMKLVEIVLTQHTSEETKEQTISLARKMKKTPVICKDSPGFIVNHVARPYYLEALRLLEKGGADIEVIDLIMESSGFKMGPFRLMDLIGNDINFAVSQSIYDSMNRPARLEPSLLQMQKLKKGELGRKSGYGFYNYDSTIKTPKP